MRFLKFLKHLFFRKGVTSNSDYPPIRTDIRDMRFIMSKTEGDSELIYHGNDDCLIEIRIRKNLKEREGKAVIRVVKGEYNLSDEDCFYLMKKYL